MIQKCPFLETFFYRQNRPGKCLLWHSRSKKRLPSQKNQEVQKVEKLTFFQRGEPMIWVQKCLFFQRFFLGNMGQEIVFYDILKGKNAFLGYKRRSSKRRKIDIFPKGLTNGFGTKMVIFATFFFGRIGQKNVFYDLLERKNAFLAKKIKKFKKSNNWHFSIRFNPWFGSKNALFSNFYFTQYRPGKCLLWYSRTTKRLSRL